MQVGFDQYDNLVLSEVYSGVILETSEGNKIGVCMRDDTFEINVLPNGKNSDNWWRVDMEAGTIEKMGCDPAPVVDPDGEPLRQE
jgi:hypothetical protein